MTVLWIVLISVQLVVAIGTLVDVFRRVDSGWAMLGWSLLVFAVPLLGAVIYWLRRPSSPEEVEQAYLAEADRRHARASQPFDSTGLRS